MLRATTVTRARPLFLRMSASVEGEAPWYFGSDTRELYEDFGWLILTYCAHGAVPDEQDVFELPRGRHGDSLVVA